MLGFHSEIRPATIRDLTAQTEVPAPQIYINLINNQQVTVQPNTVHTFYYKTKWTQGLDSSCQGNLDQAEVKQSDGTWKCESYVKETPIIQQCQVKADCPILPACDAQKDLISCNNHLCDFSAFSPACKNQLITYQEKVTEIENTKFVSLPSGANSFFCFFSSGKTSCNIGEKSISVQAPQYMCTSPSDSSELVSTGTKPDNCWKSSMSFNRNDFSFENNQAIQDIGYGIKMENSMSASIINGKLRDDWSIATKIILPDNFLEMKIKDAGKKYVLKDSNEQVTFTITNKLFGMDGGYTIQTTNSALQGGVVIRDETKDLFLKEGDNDITYAAKTSQFGSITDIIGAFGKVTTDREYVMKSNQDGRQKFLVISKEVVTKLPEQTESPKTEIIQKETASQPAKETAKKIPIWIYVSAIVFVGFIALLTLFFKFHKSKKKKKKFSLKSG